MIVIVDYEMGNVGSVQKSFERVGLETVLTSDPSRILSADGVVLPGVGAFGDAMEALTRKNLLTVLREVARRKQPLIGICLGMQLLFEKSFEKGVHQGLGILKGVTLPIETNLKVPHMGWNELNIKKKHPILAGIKEDTFVYFVHSYHVSVKQAGQIIATSEYDGPKVAVVAQDSVVGIQFHPEKSSREGLKILENFGGMVKTYESDSSNRS